MRELGYLYVLANSAMPNMVKVGKTTRSSLERADELSKATGLPTPFIVVYEQLFADCGAAESFVHVYLEEKGYRVADNREFFNAPVSVIVKAIVLAPNAIDNESSQLAFEQDEDDLLEHNEPDEFDDLCLDDIEPTYHWTAIFNEAKAHYYGLGDYIEDYTEALRLFRQAAKLGSLPAYAYIGQMYEKGEGLREDTKKALEFYKEGARKGSVYCYWKMAMLFADQYNDKNAEKCFSLFIKNNLKKLPDDQALTSGELDFIFLDCCIHILSRFKKRGKEYAILHSFIAENSSNISNKARYMIERDIGDIEEHESVLEYLDSL